MLSLPLGVFIVLLVSYALGSIPFGVIVARVGYGADPRDGGSGSIGMTNMNRLFGVKAAAITFAGDVGKGAAASGITWALLPCMAVQSVSVQDGVLICAVIASIAGHVFCPWLRFKGGKGISTGLGSIVVAFPRVLLCMLVLFLVFALLTKTISAGSIAAAIAFPVFTCAFHWGSWLLIGASFVVACAVVFAHRDNIRRLLAGNEPKFSFNTGKGHKAATHGGADGRMSDGDDAR